MGKCKNELDSSLKKMGNLCTSLKLVKDFDDRPQSIYNNPMSLPTDAARVLPASSTSGFQITQYFFLVGRGSAKRSKHLTLIEIKRKNIFILYLMTQSVMS